MPEPSDLSPIPPVAQSYENPPYALVQPAGKPLNPYEEHFANLILQLAAANHTRIVLLHIPIDSEQGLNYMPERSRWTDTLHTSAPMIGVTSAALFANINNAIVDDYYRDQHFNLNGSLLFTRAVLPALLTAYDDRSEGE